MREIRKSYTTLLYRSITERVRNPRTAEMYGRYAGHSNGIEMFKSFHTNIMKLRLTSIWDRTDGCGPIGSYLLSVRVDPDAPMRWMEVSVSRWGLTGYSKAHRTGITMRIADQPKHVQDFINNNIIPTL